MNETLHISCPHCGTTNRVQTARMRQQPTCGQCRQSLFAGKPQELNAGNLQAVLEKNDIPVVVDCWAPWCGPCRSFAPVFEQAAKTLEPAARFAKLNTEQEQAVAARWGIRSIPTLIVFRGGREVQRIAGALPSPQLLQWLKQQGIG